MLFRYKVCITIAVLSMIVITGLLSVISSGYWLIVSILFLIALIGLLFGEYLDNKKKK